MSLANRLSAFFLAAMGLVVVGFSIALYASVRLYLHRQLGDRLESSLSILTAAAEAHPEGVEWEAQARLLPLGQESGPERLRWMVHDIRGPRIDHSRNLVDANLTADWTPRRGDLSLPNQLTDRQGRHWRVAQRRLTPGPGVPNPAPGEAGIRAQRHDIDTPGGLYPGLVLTVCAPSDPAEGSLAALGWMLVGLSASVWLAAALSGRWLLRRALRPLTRMVESARGLDATDVGWGLEEPGTGDELADLGRAFNDLLTRLRLAYERQRRFSSDASHQLRTPLTALIGQLELALKRDRPGEEYRQILQRLHRRAVQLGQIVEALLFLGRADAQAGLPQGETLDLRRWVDAHLATCRGQGQPAGTVRDDRDQGPLLVQVHPPLLCQLVDNLLENAHKYGPSGAAVTVRTGRAEAMATLAVADLGPGVDPLDLPHIFEPFYRSARARHDGRPGAGLGLAVAQRIAVAFGGTIAVRSEPGVGSEFELRLPEVQTPGSIRGAAESQHDGALDGVESTCMSE